MKPTVHLTATAVSEIGKALTAVLSDENILPRNEFLIVSGVQDASASVTLENWPEVDLADESTRMVVKSTLHVLWGYPHNKFDFMVQNYGLDKADFKRLLDKVETIISE